MEVRKQISITKTIIIKAIIMKAIIMNTKFISSLTAGVMGVVCVLGSCATDHEKQTPVETAVCNPTNPYEFVGIYHNEALTLALEMNDAEADLSSLDVAKNAITASDIILSRNGYTRSNTSSPPDGGFAITTEELVEITNAMIGDIDNNFMNFINSCKATVKSKLDITGLYDDLMNMDEPTLESVISYILGFEAQVIANKSTYTTQEYQAILSTTATMRNSCGYWEGKYPVPSLTRGWGWFKWLVFGLCDAAGAWAGSHAGPHIAVTTAVSASDLCAKLFDKGMVIPGDNTFGDIPLSPLPIDENNQAIMPLP